MSNQLGLASPTFWNELVGLWVDGVIYASVNTKITDALS